MEDQRFNVVAVMKLSPDDSKGPEAFNGEIVLTVRSARTCGVNLVRNAVIFQDDEYEYSFLYVRPGLEDLAVVIGINNPFNPPYTEWVLYTDTPVPRGEYTATPERIRELAQKHIKLFS